jgi:hypothetical protein
MMKRAMIFMMPLIMAGCAAIRPAPPPDVRQIRWGWSPERVKRAEAGEGLYPLGQRPGYLVYRETIAGRSCHLVYCFVDNKLAAAAYMFDDGNAELYLEFLDRLARKHGPPDDSGPAWKDPDDYGRPAPDPANKTLMMIEMDTLVITGRAGFISIWRNDRTEIGLMMERSDNKKKFSDVTILYQALEFKDRLRDIRLHDL